MRKSVILWLVLLSLLLMSGCSKGTTTEAFIEDNHINATIIISSLKSGKEYIINKERSGVGFLPASTFKIPNTLIALQEGAIEDENEIIKWDGTDKGNPQWHKDQSLKEAFPSSCVWFYQELAKRVGNENYLAYLSDLNYGNKRTGARVEDFWLEGDIRISATEQISFLKKVYNEEFNFDKAYYAILKDIMIEESNSQYTLRGKRGWAQRVKPQIGWYVGYVETSEDTWFFACNLDINSESDAEYRKALVMDYFRDLKIIQ